MTEEKFGIKEIGEIVDFANATITAYETASEDGKVDFSDFPAFMVPISKISPAIKNAEVALQELIDLDKDDITELLPKLRVHIDNPDTLEMVYHFLCFVSKMIKALGKNASTANNA